MKFKSLLTYSLVTLSGMVIGSVMDSHNAEAGESMDTPAVSELEHATLQGAEIFAKRCAHCHTSTVIEPSILGLARLNAETIYRTLWSGVMREAANGLDDAERHAVAEYVAGLQPETKSYELANICAAGLKHRSGDWSRWAPQVGNTRYAEGINLSIAQVRDARLKWAFVIPDTGSTTNAGNQATIANGRVYVGSRSGFVFSLDAETGCVHWVNRPDAGVRSAVSIVNGLAVFADYENRVYVVDADTGSLKWSRKADSQPSARVNGSVVVHDEVIFVPTSTNQGFVNALDPRLPCCSFQGTVTAFDLRTGDRLWQTNIVDQPLRLLGQTSSGTKRYGPSGGGVWSVPTVDANRGLIYVGTSNQKTGPPIPESDAVVAIDMASGKKVWVRNFAPERLGNDIWNGGCVGVIGDPEEECPSENKTGQGDRDIGAPIVIEKRSDGSEVLIVGTKDGMLYALDPDQQGAVIWETRVGRILRITGPSFGGIEHGIASDGKKAYVPINDVDVVEGVAYGAMLAVDLMTGDILWRADSSEKWCENKPDRCHNALSAPPTVVGNVVFAGASDGVLRAYDIDTGDVVWSWDTVAEIKGVDGRTGRGGSIIRGGTAVIDGMFFQTSGYGQGLGMPGNVLYAFEFPALERASQSRHTSSNKN